VFSTCRRIPWAGWGGGGGSPEGLYLYTQDSTTLKDKDRHPCLEWYSSPRSHYSNGEDTPSTPLTLFVDIVFNYCSDVLFAMLQTSAVRKASLRDTQTF
jgi:hypothetical protein